MRYIIALLLAIPILSSCIVAEEGYYAPPQRVYAAPPVEVSPAYPQPYYGPRYYTPPPVVDVYQYPERPRVIIQRPRRPGPIIVQPYPRNRGGVIVTRPGRGPIVHRHPQGRGNVHGHPDNSRVIVTGPGSRQQENVHGHPDNQRVIVNRPGDPSAVEHGHNDNVYGHR